MKAISRDRIDEVVAGASFSSDPRVVGVWMVYGTEAGDYVREDRRVVARFPLPADGEAQLLDVSADAGEPNVMVVYRKPHVSRGRSPKGTLLSPCELFLAFKPDEPMPEVLPRHHAKLARLGIFDPEPRRLAAPLWGVPNPDLPPEYGAINLCAGNFPNEWPWFSMGHGVNNQHRAMELWTGWSVVTGNSAPRSAALCMTKSTEDSARARYVILNKQGAGPWQDIFSTDWVGPGEGVGFQTYGPDEGRTRILPTTEDDDHHVFWAGASWGTPQDWLSP